MKSSHAFCIEEVMEMDTEPCRTAINYIKSELARIMWIKKDARSRAPANQVLKYMVLTFTGG
ncbi:MAG: hypothetical protein MZV63_62235 [Marinilabiliales bacterium]|nr:hypothetical protein [Marinilabiliales bacterium]